MTSLADILQGAVEFCKAHSDGSLEGSAKVNGYLLAVGVNLTRKLEPGYDAFKQGFSKLLNQYSSPDGLREIGELLQQATGFDWELLCRTVYGGLNESR